MLSIIRIKLIMNDKINYSTGLKISGKLLNLSEWLK